MNGWADKYNILKCNIQGVMKIAVLIACDVTSARRVKRIAKLTKDQQLCVLININIMLIIKDDISYWSADLITDLNTDNLRFYTVNKTELMSC